MRSFRIAYISGPIGAAELYRSWRRRKQGDFFGTIYLNQYFDICADFGAEGYVIMTLPGQMKVERLGNIIFENCPPPNQSGAQYHAGMLLRAGLGFLHRALSGTSA